MEIFICVVPAIIVMAIWFVKLLIQDKRFLKKNDNKTRVKREVYYPESYNYHNSQFRKRGEKTTILWKVEKIDSQMEERMRKRIENKNEE